MDEMKKGLALVNDGKMSLFEAMIAMILCVPPGTGDYCESEHPVKDEAQDILGDADSD